MASKIDLNTRSRYSETTSAQDPCNPCFSPGQTAGQPRHQINYFHWWKFTHQPIQCRPRSSRRRNCSLLPLTCRGIGRAVRTTSRLRRRRGLVAVCQTRFLLRAVFTGVQCVELYELCWFSCI